MESHTYCQVWSWSCVDSFMARSWGLSTISLSVPWLISHYHLLQKKTQYKVMKAVLQPYCFTLTTKISSSPYVKKIKGFTPLKIQIEIELKDIESTSKCQMWKYQRYISDELYAYKPLPSCMEKCLSNLLNLDLFPSGLNGNSTPEFPQIIVQPFWHVEIYKPWHFLSLLLQCSVKLTLRSNGMMQKWQKTPKPNQIQTAATTTWYADEAL